MPEVAYVDTSYWVAVTFGERRASTLRRQLAKFERLVASNLLEAELRAVFARERASFEANALAGISWIVPERLLSAEIARVRNVGYLRGADCWHLATALYLVDDPGTITFLTLDARQRAVATALGFRSQPNRR